MVDEKFLFISMVLIVSVAGSALNGLCSRNEECGTFDTYCKNGTCVCKQDFAIHVDTCVHLATPRMDCLNKKDCRAVMGSRSSCKNNMCACKSFHHIYQKQCVKSRGLDEECEFDYQCYCGENCSQHIECRNYFCKCKSDAQQHSRRCIGNSNSSTPIVTILESSESISTASSIYHSAISQLLIISTYFIFVQMF